MDELSTVDNPFRSSIVADPWQANNVDVLDIHAGVFEDCCQAVDWVRAHGQSTSFLIHGEAGGGKTHLLSRLRNWVISDDHPGLDESVFAWVRLQTSPRMIWRHVRRRFVDDLLRSTAQGTSQFQRVVLRRLAELRTADGDLYLWWQWIQEEAPQDLAELLHKLWELADLDRNVAVACEHLVLGRHTRDAQHWLRGEALPASAMTRLDLATPEVGNDDDDHPEHAARQVVLSLCRLVGTGLPVIFGFDQVEALQTHPDDVAGLFAFGQLASTLHDETTNVLTLSCIQSSFSDLLKAKIRGADYDRLREHGIQALLRLTWSQTVKLVTARLDSNAELQSLREGQDDPLWPLEAARLKASVPAHGITPRELLSLCAEEFARIRDGKPIELPPLDSILTELWETRYQELLTGNTPEQSEQILMHGLPVLVSTLNGSWKTVDEPLLPDVEVIFETPAGRIGISVCMQPHMTTLAKRLGRLRNQMELGRLTRLTILRDPRTPITTSAKKAREHLTALEQQGAKFCEPGLEALAALDALRTLLSESRAGDLAVNGATLEPATVQQWLVAHLPDSLRNLVQNVVPEITTTTTAPAADLAVELAALLAEQHLLPLEEAARRLNRPVADIEHVVRNSAEQFGLLCGPPPVIFQRLERAAG